MTAIKVHAFWPDGTAVDWNGQPGCAHCPLPKEHQLHTVEPPSDDVSDRLIGEHDEETE